MPEGPATQRLECCESLCSLMILVAANRLDCLLADTKFEERFVEHTHMIAPPLELEQVMEARQRSVVVWCVCVMIL